MHDLQRIFLFKKVRLIANIFTIFLPVTVLIALGLSAIFLSEIAMMVFIGTSAVVSVTVLLSIAMKKRENAIEMTEYLNTEGLGKASDNWSSSELTLWELQKENIATLLKHDNNWNVIYRVYALSIATEVAAFYKKNSPFEVNFIEILIASEELSKRYRKILRNNFPFIEEAKISTIINTINAYQNFSPYIFVASDTFGAVKSVVKPFINLPGLLAELVQGYASNKVKNNITDKIEYQLKRTLLEEIVAVSIDLYSGRFSFANDELGASAGLQKDEKIKNLPLEPIRVAVIGQISSGKSTVTNILCKETLAETDILPSTDDLIVYSAMVDGLEQVRIIDLPGLDNTEDSNKQTLNEILESDIVLWTLRANQTARNNDVILREQINAFYLENPHRKAPKIIGVITQIDKLSSSTDLSSFGSISELIEPSIMEQIIKHNTDLLSLDGAVVISSVNGKTIGAESLENILAKYLWDAQQSQLNRRRIEASSTSLIKQFKRIFLSSRSVAGSFK
jgi:GTPase Era involved in 16S rRNA processing